MKNYRVRTSCEVLGIWREAGSVLTLTERQAKELTAPYGNVVTLVDNGMEEEPDAGFDRSKRRSRRLPQ